MLEGSIDIGKERITLAGPDGCYYRAAVSQGLPFDYSLWPNTKSCNDGNISASCAPTSTEDPFANSDLTLSPAELALKTLPENDAELELFLLKAAQNGQITWISHADNREVYAVLQTEIDSSAKGQDVHLVFGNNHFAEQQAEFFTELITEGRDQLQVQGITHVVWELFNRNNDQSLIDNYLVTGKRHFNIDYGEFLGKDSALAKAKERLAETFLKAVSLECYNLVGSNAELNVPMTFSSANGYFDSIESREKTVVSYFNFRQDPGKKDVAFWLWGNSHVEKHRIPFFLHRAYPGAKVVSVVLNGGRFNPSYSFDRVLKKLGWLDRAFILRLDGFREADYVIHLPTYGRQDRSKSMEQEFFPQYPVLMPMVAPPL